MKLSEVFSSPYLKAADIADRQPVVKISKVDFIKFKSDEGTAIKIVLSFEGKDKQLSCNATNRKLLEAFFGDETDDWVGQSISLRTVSTVFKGTPTMGISVSLPKSSNSAPVPKPAPKQENVLENDDIPF